MEMDKNTVIGLILIFALFFAWQYFMAPSPEEAAAERARQDSLAQVTYTQDSLASLKAEDQRIKRVESVTPEVQDSVLDSLRQLEMAGQFGPFAPAALGTAREVVLENDVLRVRFTSKGGKVEDVLLKDQYRLVKDENGEEMKKPIHLLSDQRDRFDFFFPIASLPGGGVKSSDLFFEVVEASPEKVVFRANAGLDRAFEQEYSLVPDSYKMDYQIRFINLNGVLATQDQGITLQWTNHIEKLEKSERFELMYSSVYMKPEGKRVKRCNPNAKSNEKDSGGEPVRWISHTNQFFNTSIVAEKPFGPATISSQKLENELDHLKKYTTQVVVPLEGTEEEVLAMHYYVGPNEFKRLQSMGFSLQDVIPFGQSILGTINRWVIRPVFGFLSSFISSPGLVILALTFLVKMALYPLTYRMLYSQSKMAALKPEMEKVKAKHKDDQQAQQVETMKMYREFGVNPLGGCLPMVLQMPIWIALYRFFPASIEFRQASFLWANDLSSYDEFFTLPFEIPFFGSHLSLFTLLWAISTLVYTYYNTRHMDMSANPAMKYMQYLMPVFFLGFFNSYASGLTAYLLFSNLITIAQTLITKNVIINQDKIKREMDAYRAKPKKKGGFQHRLEQALKEQQKVAAERQAKGNGRQRSASARKKK